MKSLVLILPLLLLSMAPMHEANLKLDGRVVSEKDTPLRQVDVRIQKEDGTLVSELKTGVSGYFEMLIEFDMTVEIHFMKKGYRTKVLKVNTFDVPAREREWGYEFGVFKVKLEKGNPSGTALLAGEIYFDTREENFLTRAPTEQGQ